jgi:hypothetical protein
MHALLLHGRQVKLCMNDIGVSTTPQQQLHYLVV